MSRRTEKKYRVYYQIPGNEELDIWTFAGWDIGIKKTIQLIRDYECYNGFKIFPEIKTRKEIDEYLDKLFSCKTKEDIMALVPRIKITEEEILV